MVSGEPAILVPAIGTLSSWNMDVPEMRVLIVDDDCAFSDTLGAYLQKQGCVVNAISEPARCGEALRDGLPDIILLDQRFLGSTGTDVLRQIRAVSSVPVIMVTGLSDPLDRIVNLEIGADDEVEKTIAPRELLARMKGVLRRSRLAPLPQERAEPKSILGQWTLDMSRRVLSRPDGMTCRLTTAEYEMLACLHASLGAPVSRGVLSEAVFKRPCRIGDRGVDSVIKKLRRKIEISPKDPQSIKSVRPLGYVFVGFPAADAT